MNRRKFIKSTLLGASAFFVPNAVLAFGRKSNLEKTLDPKETFFVQPDLKDYKFDADGTAFFQTKIGFRLNETKNVFLPKEFRVSHERNGYGTPAFYSDGRKQFVFISELFTGSKMNGWIYEYDKKRGFAAHRAFQHENMGWYAFWGKPVNGKPALYHFNYSGFYMTQTAFLDGKWQTNRIYNTVPDEAVRLYESQVNHPDYPNQANQFGFEWRVSPDGFYDFLKMKHDWEQSKLQIIKDELEERERRQPSVTSSLQSERMTRVFRNRQCLANVSENCGCEAAEQTSATDANNLRIVKTQNLKNGEVGTSANDAVYQTRLGFYDERNVYHEIPETLHCAEDVLGEKKPVLFGDGTDYYLSVAEIRNGEERRFLYKFDEKKNWNKEEVLAEQNWGKADFAAFASSENPIVFLENRQVKVDAKFVKAKFEKAEPSKISSALTLNRLILQQQQTIRSTNPLVPIYCEGDDLSKAAVKPTVIYKEVAGTKTEIPNMPAYKTQNQLGECRAFALAALIQWYACYEWKKDIPDCKNPPADSAISYFGMMMYTHQDYDIGETFQPDQDISRGMWDILGHIRLKGNNFILESCKPFNVMATNFDMNTGEGKRKKDAFFDYLRKMYDSNKGKTEADIKDCLDCIKEINKNAGLNASVVSLKKALLKDSYDKFLYSLFFDGCELEGFPFSYQPVVYPSDNLNITSEDLKQKIIQTVKSGKPVLFPKMCFIFDSKNRCQYGHAILISGYKKVCKVGKANECKDVFKVHNSWGEEWQKRNNDGWSDADSIVSNVYKNREGDKNSVQSASAAWFEYPE